MPNGTLEDQIHNGPIIDIITSCKECDSKHLARDYERGELVCEDCGLVLEDCAIDRGREWVGGGKNDARKGSRGVGPINNITKVNNLSTLVGYGRDGHRRYIPAYKEPMMKRLRTLQKIEGIKAAGNVNLGRAMRELGRQISYLELPPAIKNQSAYLYKHAVSKKIIRGRTIEVMVGASIYAACIQQNIPRTLQEMAGASKKRKKDVAAAYRILRNALSLNLPPTKPSDYVARFCSELELSNNARVYTMDLLDIIEKKDLLINRSPVIVATTAIYKSTIDCGEYRTQDNMEAITKITGVTIRNRYQELKSKLDELGITVR